MSNNKNNVFIKTTLFVVLAIILTVGVTYAYFRADITGVESESTISVGGAQLSITYVGTETITAENVIPGWSAKKYFNITSNNPSNIPITFDVVLVIDKSNFNTGWGGSNSYLSSYMYKCSSSTDKTCSKLSGLIVSKQSGKITQQRITTTTNGTEYYAFELVFPDTRVEQNQTGTDGKVLTFQGHIEIESSQNIYESDFGKDSWSTIASNIQSGNESLYKVGDEKEVEIDVDGDGIVESYTVRVANNTTPSECSTTGFSQTACGFVVEFVDIVEKRAMNSIDENYGGWPAMDMYKYLNGIKNADDEWDRNNTLYSKLPSDLQSVIADTYVVSGHGAEYRNYNTTRTDGNWVSTDKLYLLSPGEICSNCLTSNCYDTASFPYEGSGATTTRQLDYYKNLSVSLSSNYSNAIKNYNGTAAWWWLRAAESKHHMTFDGVPFDGYAIYDGVLASTTTGGVAPAFRVA